MTVRSCLFPSRHNHLIRFIGTNVFSLEESGSVLQSAEQGNVGAPFAVLEPLMPTGWEGVCHGEWELEESPAQTEAQTRALPSDQRSAGWWVSRVPASGTTNHQGDWGKSPGFPVGPQFLHLQNGMTRPSSRIVVGIKEDHLHKALQMVTVPRPASSTFFSW